MQINGQRFFPESAIAEVISNTALSVVQNKDGRQFSDYDLGRLQALASVARDLDLPSAARFEQLVNIAERGQVRDIERAALTVLTQVD